MKDPYAAQCAWSMQALRRQYQRNFWADPNEFFSDGPLVNMGSDFGLMPSLFEPSGVVQQEYFSGNPCSISSSNMNRWYFRHCIQDWRIKGYCI